MTKHRNRFGGRLLWLWGMAFALSLIAACYDETGPRYIPPQPDSTENTDSTQSQG